MPSVANNKTSRLNARITLELRDRLRYVAARQGRSVSDYVTATLHQAVLRDVAEMDIVRLSRADAEHFATALIDASPLAQSMRRGIELHRRLVRPE